MEKINNALGSTNRENYLLFFLLCFLSLVGSWMFNKFLITEDFFFNSYIDQISSESLEKYFELQQKWQWGGYILTPIFLLIKVSIISAIIHIGCFFYEKEVIYKRIFNTVLKVEYIFVLVIFIKVMWFIVFRIDYALKDLQFFYPLSLINLVDYNNIRSWFSYPLKTINLFEVVYWLVLAYLLGKEFKEDIYKGLTVVASSYGVGLVIWVVAVMFFTLNVS